MRKKLLLLGGLWICAGAAAADERLGAYTARLGVYDHLGPYGERLDSPARIVGRDRENFHKIGLRDAEDEDDALFRTTARREVLQDLLERGDTPPEVYRAILDGTPLIRIEVYTSAWRGDYATVLLLNE